MYAARALPSFDWNEPSSRIITENFLEVVVTAEAEAPLVRSAPEYRGAERLCGHGFKWKISIQPETYPT